jgi:hypothetical protein
VCGSPGSGRGSPGSGRGSPRPGRGSSGSILPSPPTRHCLLISQFENARIAQLVERLVRKKFGRLWTRRVLCGQSGQIVLIDAVLVETAPTHEDLKGPNFRRRYRLGYRRQSLVLRVVYGFRYLPPRGTLLTRLSSACAFPSNKRFRNDDVLSIGSDLGRARDSASRLPEVAFGAARPENDVKIDALSTGRQTC